MFRKEITGIPPGQLIIIKQRSRFCSRWVTCLSAKRVGLMCSTSAGWRLDSCVDFVRRYVPCACSMLVFPARHCGDFHFAWMKVPLTRITLLILAHILLGDSCLDFVRRCVPCASSMLVFFLFGTALRCFPLRLDESSTDLSLNAHVCKHRAPHCRKNANKDIHPVRTRDPGTMLEFQERGNASLSCCRTSFGFLLY